MIAIDAVEPLAAAMPEMIGIARDFAEIGRRAAQLMIDRLTGALTGPPVTIVLPSRSLLAEAAAADPPALQMVGAAQQMLTFSFGPSSIALTASTARGSPCMIDQEAVAFYRDHGYLVVPEVLSRGRGRGPARGHRRVRRASPRAAPATTRSTISRTAIRPPSRACAGSRRRIAGTTPTAGWSTIPRSWPCCRSCGAPRSASTSSKLNLKAAGYGAPVEWHQDWAFYPHTNDDLAAVGIMIDDVDHANGPLLVIPGSHKGPIFDHHADGVFCGAMDPARGEVDYRTRGAADRPGRLDHHPPRPHRARLGDQQLGPAAPPAAAPVPRRRRLAAARRAEITARSAASCCAARRPSSRA